MSALNAKSLDDLESLEKVRDKYGIIHVKIVNSQEFWLGSDMVMRTSREISTRRTERIAESNHANR